MDSLESKNSGGVKYEEEEETVGSATATDSTDSVGAASSVGSADSVGSTGSASSFVSSIFLFLPPWAVQAGNGQPPAVCNAL